MVKKRFFWVFGIIFLLALVGFSIAAVIAPVGLYFSQNSTSTFDNDGTLFLNWTAGGSDEANYTIFVSVDGGSNWFNDSLNDSETGYTFINITGANYTFLVQATNDTLDNANSSKISIVVDTTSPAIEYGGGLQSNNANVSQNFTFVNVTATDTYNDTLSFSLYNTTGLVNQTNFTDYYATLTINWTGLSDGIYYYNVTANDSATNSNSTETYKITLDTTSPTISFSCSPSSVRVGESVSCSCSGTDATSGINTTSYTASPSTSSVGSFTETCVITDYAGNSVSNTSTYGVTTSSNSGVGSSSENNWSKTFVPSQTQFQNGYTQTLKENERVKLTIKSVIHYVGLENINSNSVDLIITSDPIEITLSLAESKRVDIDDDGFYDLYLYLDSLDTSEAGITILSINEEVKENLDEGLLEGDNKTFLGEEENTKVKKERNFLWLWIILGIIGLLAIACGVYWLIKNKK